MKLRLLSMGLLAIGALFLSACETDDQEPNNTDAEAVSNGGYYWNHPDGPRFIQAPYIPYIPESPLASELVIEGELDNEDTDIFYPWMMAITDIYPRGDTLPISIVIDRVQTIEGPPEYASLPGYLEAWRCTDITVANWLNCAPEDQEAILLHASLASLLQSASYDITMTRGQLMKLVVKGFQTLPEPYNVEYRIKMIPR